MRINPYVVYSTPLAWNNAMNAALGTNEQSIFFGNGALLGQSGVAFGNNDTFHVGDDAVVGLNGQNNSVVAGGNSVVWEQYGGANNGDNIQIGADSVVYLSDSHNSVIDQVEGSVKGALPYIQGGGNLTQLAGDSHTTVNLTGAGDVHGVVQVVGYPHGGSSVDEGHNTINVAAGLASGTTINFSNGTEDNTVNLNGGGRLAIHENGIGTVPVPLPVFGVSDTIVNVDEVGGTVHWFGVDPTSDLLGLAPNLGFSSGADAYNHLTSDGHGGSLLTFANHLGSADFVGVDPSHLSAANFQVG